MLCLDGPWIHCQKHPQFNVIFSEAILAVDTVFIEELKVDTIVGLYPWERKVPQTLLISIDMAFDNRVVAASGELKDAINYAEVVARVTDHIQKEQYLLLETLAEECVALIMNEFKVPWVRFKCKKTQVIPDACGVGVAIERGEWL